MDAPVAISGNISGTDMHDVDARTPEADNEIDKLKTQLQTQQERYLRVLAEFANFRRRSEKEHADAFRAGKLELILSLLDVIDNIELARRHLTEANEPVVAGVRAIYQQFMTLLKKHGVTPIESLGKLFDPELHEAVATTEKDGCQAGTVVEELRRGYLWDGALLRPASVLVAKGRAAGLLDSELMREQTSIPREKTI